MKSWVLAGDVLEIADGETRIPATADQIYAAVLEDASVWPELAGGKSGDARELTFSRYPVDLAAVIDADPETGHPRVSFEARTQEGNSFAVSSLAMARGHAVHRGTWYPGAPENAETVLAVLDEAGYDPEAGRLKTLKGLLHLKKAAREDSSVIDRFADEMLRDLIFRNADTGGPKGIDKKLYRYQRDGWQWLRFIIREQLGGLLADEMGLGKTLQVISALRDPGGERNDEGALVIAPGSILENWMREMGRFCPDLKTLKHHGPTRTGRPADLKGFDVVVASYDTATRDLSLLKMIEWNAVILDEAQYIRNPDAQRTKAVKQIGRRVSLAVTGTPLENRLRDLWSIMDFAVPGYLGDLKSFEARYCEEAGDAAELEPVVSPLMLRRRVREVAKDLPERIDIPEVLDLCETEADAYEAVRNAISDEYRTAAKLVSLVRLRQFCAHPGIIAGGGYDPGETFSKLERLKELLEEIFLSGEKVLVFTTYTKMADRIAGMVIRDFDTMAETFDGRLAMEDRQPLIDRFSAIAGPAVLVLNPRAGGSGLNITAANHVIHYNPEWNPALEDQASARAHRLGQERPVTVRRLICGSTVEEVIDERLRRKRDLADAAVTGVEGREEDRADIVAALKRSPTYR